MHHDIGEQPAVFGIDLPKRLGGTPVDSKDGRSGDVLEGWEDFVIQRVRGLRETPHALRLIQHALTIALLAGPAAAPCCRARAA